MHALSGRALGWFGVWLREHSLQMDRTAPHTHPSAGVADTCFHQQRPAQVITSCETVIYGHSWQKGRQLLEHLGAVDEGADLVDLGRSDC